MENRLQVCHLMKLGHMLDWLSELNTAFPEAVPLAIQMPCPSWEHTRILARLVTKKTWENHPEHAEAVAQLMIYLWHCDIPYHKRHGTVERIVERLLKSNVSPELKSKLEEIKVQL